MAGKTNESGSEIDKTSFFFGGLCGICHPGGGFAEYDRDGQLYYDVATGQFGYEKLGKTAADVELDGDYAFLNPQTGELGTGRWDITGVSEPDCLLCHRKERAVSEGKNMNWIWRTATLRASAGLVNSKGKSIPAFATGPTASQGWIANAVFADTPAGVPPMFASVDVDYSVGLSDGSLQETGDGLLALAGASIQREPPDYACWGCHVTPDIRKRGRVWFDPDQDVHYAGFNHLDDDDPSNDVDPLVSTACTECHKADASHSFAKGNALLGTVEDESDYEDFRTCRDCHLENSEDRDPEAPSPADRIHTQPGHDQMSCQFCHVPYKSAAADLVIDQATTGVQTFYSTAVFLSANPIDPTDPDDSRWYPTFKWKTDKDRVKRLYPAKLLVTSWWGDWDDKGTPKKNSDDVVKPIPLWRLRQITKGQALSGVADDNGDGVPEVNTRTEILTYIDALKKGNDSFGNPIASNPVLVKGLTMWFADASDPSGVSSLDYEEEGIHTEATHPFSADHNVRPTRKAIGRIGCGECHRNLNGGLATPTFDRMILVDPWDETGQPVYETVRSLTGVSPP